MAFDDPAIERRQLRAQAEAAPISTLRLLMTATRFVAASRRAAATDRQSATGLKDVEMA